MATAYRWSGEIPQGQKAGLYGPRLSRLKARYGMQVLRRPEGPDEMGPRLKAQPTSAGGRIESASSLATRSLRRELMGGNCNKLAMVEFYTVKRIDNSRLVRHVEPAKMRNLYRAAALGAIIAVFLMMYTYQHFRCIDLSFQLEDLKGKQTQAAELNGKLKLQIATLRDPHRIDVIAQHELGFKRPEANQVREYVNLDGSEVAALQYTRLNRRP
jgi:cell division protein FtsL